jgi:acyl carrier protein
MRMPEGWAPSGDCGGFDKQNMNSIKDTVLDIIAKEGSIDRASITLESTLRDLNIHSLDGVQIVFALEDTFDICVPEDQVQHATGTVAELIEGIERLVAAKSEPVAKIGA